MITVDVEDWFQVENFKTVIDASSWNALELRVERNVHRLLDLLDEAACHLSSQVGSTNETDRVVQPPCLRATFFILGWVAGKLPHLVREIHGRGHEVASHGFNHDLCPAISTKRLKKDLIDSKKLLEDTVGTDIIGYRAPSFSINDDVIRLIADVGYRYDSSFNSFAMHGRYGSCEQCVRSSPNASIIDLGNGLFELPIGNLRLSTITLPWGGGGYFRMLPPFLFRLGVARILKKSRTYVFYLHPWELDPDQPVVHEAPWRYRFRHYLNLDKTAHRLGNLVQDFRGCHFVSCTQLLKKNGCMQ